MRRQIVLATLGCRLNQIESESAARFFSSQNFSVSLEPLSSSTPACRGTLLCAVNTCAVTQKAEQKARRAIRIALEKFPNAVVVATGCLAERSPSSLRAISGRVAALPGTLKSRLSEIPALLKAAAEGGEEFSAESFALSLESGLFARAREKDGFPESPFVFSTDAFLAHSRASMKIQDGCDNACSYCAIHLARGRSVSLGAREALERALSLERAGFREISLTGVNVAQWRGEIDERGTGFAGLLKFLLRGTSAVNFRLSSVYPEIVDDEFCEALSDERIRPHFHISAQSGSDKILRAMNRRTGAREIAEAVKKLRAAKRLPFVACDMIAGFPGESEEDFGETMALCEECGFAHVHAFPFSPREGTAAFSMRPKVPERVARERVERLMEFSAKSKARYIKSCEPFALKAIAQTGAAADGRTVVVTENFLHCALPSGTKAGNSRDEISVRITRALEGNIARGDAIEAEAVLA